tara:strand:+ start:229 stop:2163 length:1935 start_codon:yes stop_codon:yes gene_type:complete
MKVIDIISNINQGLWTLPEFQRGYVWNRKQVRQLMDSLYKNYPIGSLLVWSTKTENAAQRGKNISTYDSIKLILDGQQRVTTLFGIITGKAPPFFEGNSDSFTNLYFNVENESFEFYGPRTMGGNKAWVSVTDIMKKGAPEVFFEIQNELSLEKQKIYLARMNQINNIREKDLNFEELNDRYTVDTVVDIFNKVNSSGTSLSKGDLALAKISARWPAARDEMKKIINDWRNEGYSFTLDWLLRCVNAISTHEALFSHLDKLSINDFQEGLNKSKKYIDYLLNLLSSRLGIDHDRVLGSRYSFPVMALYLDKKGGAINDHKERNKLLYWYIHTFMWGRYAGSTESIINADLKILEESDGNIDNLIEEIKESRGGTLEIRESDFDTWGKGARLYPVLYMLTRTNQTLDMESGIELREQLLGKRNTLEIHHIFPKSKLYDNRYEKKDVNALANFTFLTKGSNQHISNKDPNVYLGEIFTKTPGVLESHWIPTDQRLWKIENYKEFLSTRRQLITKSANDFLQELYSSDLDSKDVVQQNFIDKKSVELEENEEENEKKLLIDLNEFAIEYGFPSGIFDFELSNEEGDFIALIDLAWSSGLQLGLSTPIALMLNEDQETINKVLDNGYKVISSQDSFYNYLEILSDQKI